jgi:VWFA-related protein
MKRAKAWLIVVGAAATLGTLGAQQTPPPQQGPPIQEIPSRPVFKSGTNVVPIDVRALDGRGRPVTDLTQADFTVLENGKPQKVEFFATNALKPAPPDTSVSVRHAASVPTTLAPQNRRLFLIVFGRGRLQEPSKGLDATLRFVRERLLPQDQVAVMAWNRSTDFTTEHAKTAEVIERFRKEHENIEGLLKQRFGGLTALYGGSQIPKDIQVHIDNVFGGPSGAASRQIIPNRLSRAESDAQRTLDAMLNGTAGASAFGLFGTDVTIANGMNNPTLGMTFDQYVALNRQTMQDVGNLYAGIEYLRYIEGEKHLIFVTEQGFRMPRADHDRDIGRVAADARVAIDTLQTGGVATSGEGANIRVDSGFQLAALRTISEVSGGQVAVSKAAEAAYDRIVASTEFGYLLGFTSALPETAMSRPRDIKVEVKRRGVTLSYRRAYIPQPERMNFDPRQALATTRLVSAASFERELFDVRFNAKLRDIRDGQTRQVDVDLVLDVTRLGLARVGDRYVAALNFAIFAGDAYEKNIGEKWDSRDILIPASRLEDVRRNGLPLNIKVDVKNPPIHVKVIVYDYGSDRLGAQNLKMR